MAMAEYKPQVIKGLKVEYNKTVYDKIIYLSCSNEGDII